jgi:hypothetical protein
MKKLCSVRPVKLFKASISLIICVFLIYTLTKLNRFALKYITIQSNEIKFLCPSHPSSQKSPLNVTQILETFHLTSLVEFHENNTYNISTFLYSKNFKSYYMENLNRNESFNELFWQLWNTRNMSLLNTSSLEFDFTNTSSSSVQLGGSWRPGNCKSRFKLAIIIPFRDRLPHLKVLSRFLHMLLQRQLIDYRIFVVEPYKSIIFNKG